MSKEVIQVSTNVLKVHPRNTEFFDDIQGKEYEQFKQSISQDGILSPILVSPDMTVISGHQRLKACKELGINLVPIMIRDDLTDENEKLKLLLAANFGRTKNDDAKQRKIATEYVALCGRKLGDNQHTRVSDNHKPSLTQSEIASQLGISVPTLNEMLAIERKLTPEIKELLDTGVFTKTTASKILTKLTPDEQKELAKTLPTDVSLTQDQINTYVEKIKSQENQIAGYEAKLKRTDELKTRIQTLETELANRPKETVEVKPADYDRLVESNSEILKDNTRLTKQYGEKCEELVKLREQLKQMEAKTTQKQFADKLIDDSLFFCSKVNTFIRDVGGLAYLADKINDLPEKEHKSYLQAVNIVKAWADNIINNINQ